MALLPPDPRQLRAILAHLDARLAENETVALYLRLQREAVLAALAGTEHPAQPPSPSQPHPQSRQRAGRKGKGGGPLPGFAPPSVGAGFVVQQKRTPSGPEPVFIHLADCAMIAGTPHPIRADEARAALTDPTVEPCALCRPDTELGIDLA